jgi:ATPase subunit of ABC transporter with duplicated ATPase domains
MGKKKSRSRATKKTASIVKKPASTVKKRGGVAKKGRVVKTAAAPTSKRTAKAASVEPYQLWYLVDEYRLSFEPEAQVVVTGLINTGETRLAETALHEAGLDASGEITVNLTDVTQRLHQRARHSAERLFDVMVEEAGGANRPISVEALRAAEERTFCTVWPFCAKY